MRKLWLLPLVVGLMSCSQPFRDADIDLKQLTQPDPVPSVQPIAPSPVLVPPAAPRGVVPGGAWRAWVPRVVGANGDVIEGHYVEMSATAPAVEVLQPAKPMPRVPRSTFPKAGSSVAVQVPSVPVMSAPQGPAGWPVMPGQPPPRVPAYGAPSPMAPGYPPMRGE